MNLQYLTRRVSIAALILVCTGFLSAANAATSSVTYDFATAQKARNQVQALVIAGRAAQAKQLGGATTATFGGPQPAEAFANVDRAYPPSCLESPMALGLYTSDPNALQAQIRLSGDPLGDAAEQAFSEVDTVTLFRVVCSSGKSATLLEIDRPSGHDANLYPTFPRVTVPLNASTDFPIRLTDDPNTFFSATYALSPLFNSDVFVLENIYGGSVQLDYNQAFTLDVDNLNTQDSNRFTSFPLPVYNPAQYSDASLPLPISGYMSTNWTSPTQSGEGIVLQVYDDGDSATRTLAFAWFTYDDNGLPFWLFGEADAFPIVPATRSVTATTAYFTGGTFAGNLPGGVPHTIWGTVTFSFPDCAHMNISYNGNASAVHGPTGSGSATFLRVASVNGLICQ